VYLDAVASPDWEQAEKYEQEALAGTAAAWRDRHPGVDIVEKTVMGDPAKALIDESAGAELLVVGSHGRGELRGLVLGSVSHAVLHHAHCPVAVTRH
jgi:nucleotide-binding universal stress UspA family protein